MSRIASVALLIFVMGCLSTKQTKVPVTVEYQCMQICAPYKHAPDTFDGGWLCYCDMQMISPDLMPAVPKSYQHDALYKGERPKLSEPI